MMGYDESERATLDGEGTKDKERPGTREGRKEKKREDERKQ